MGLLEKVQQKRILEENLNKSKNLNNSSQVKDSCGLSMRKYLTVILLLANSSSAKIKAYFAPLFG